MTSSILSNEQKDELLKLKMWSEDCPVSLDRLCNVNINYVDFEGVSHAHGQITVFDALAESVERVFRILNELRFPIEKIQPLSIYKGSDQLSMQDNNTSCFNHRFIANSKFISLHSYGMAVDLNPLQNPYLQISEKEGIVSVSPPEGWQYINRRNRKAGMVESIIPVFEQQGFIVWGGEWTTPIDFHHFQVPRGLAEILVNLTREDGANILARVYPHRRLVRRIQSGWALAPLIEKYKVDKADFVENFFDFLPEYVN